MNLLLFSATNGSVQRDVLCDAMRQHRNKQRCLAGVQFQNGKPKMPQNEQINDGRNMMTMGHPQYDVMFGKSIFVCYAPEYVCFACGHGRACVRANVHTYL